MKNLRENFLLDPTQMYQNTAPLFYFALFILFYFRLFHVSLTFSCFFT